MDNRRRDYQENSRGAADHLFQVHDPVVIEFHGHGNEKQQNWILFMIVFQCLT